MDERGALAREARSRVELVLEAARALVAREADELAAALSRSSGLSVEGSRLALERLELAPTERELEALVRWAARPSVPARCHVVQSANVPTAALRALALGAAVSPRVLVRPSRREPVLAERLARALAAPVEVPTGASLEVRLVTELSPSPGDEVHLYGRDETVAALALGHEGRVLRMGSGLGLAAVSLGDELDAAAAGLALDVVLFDQRGCLSPRVVFVEGERERALAFAGALVTELEGWGRRAARGELDVETRAELRRWADALRATGELFEVAGGLAGLVGVSGLDGPAALAVPPAARAVLVARVSSPAEARSLAAPLGRLVTIVGGHGALSVALAALSPGARVAALGAMQRPPLDGPVDARHGSRGDATLATPATRTDA